MIQSLFGRQGAVRRVLASEVAALFGDQRGNIAALFALLLVPLVGILSLAFETSSWFLIRQAMQSTADSAVLAAAANGDAGTGTTYQTEAKAVSASLGFTNLVNHTTVLPTYAACPSPLTGNCYQVRIRRDVPLYLVGLLGYTGTSGDGGLQEIQATAYASPAVAGSDTCALVLDTNSADKAVIQNNGTMNFNGCSLQINSPNNSTGLDQANGSLTAKSVLVVGSNGTYKSVTPTPKFSQPAVQDPYTGIYSANGVSSLVTQSCPAANKNINVSGTKSISQGVYCGSLSVQSGGNLTFGSGVYIFQGVTFTTSGVVTGSNVTIILSCSVPPCTAGKSGATWSTITQNSSANSSMSLSAPTSGSWSGLLFYQDPMQTASINNFGLTFNGGSNTLQGTLYFPTQGIKQTSGTSNSQCTHIIAWVMNITSGNVNSNCAGLGVGNIGTGDSRQTLVQ
jgi:hypothetical protein